MAMPVLLKVNRYRYHSLFKSSSFRVEKAAELSALSEIEKISPIQSMEEDKAIIKFFVQCFDRPAFQDDIYQEGRMEDFDKAIEDTLIALNTGVMRTRDGEKLKQAEGKSAIQNPIWRKNSIQLQICLMISVDD